MLSDSIEYIERPAAQLRVVSGKSVRVTNNPPPPFIGVYLGVKILQYETLLSWTTIFQIF